MLPSLTDGLGDRLSHYRRLAGLSAQELSDRLDGGISRAVIANIENGRKADVSIDQIAAFARALEVPFFALALPLHLPWESVVIGTDTMSVLDAWEWLSDRPEPFRGRTARGGNPASVVAHSIMRGLRELAQLQRDAQSLKEKVDAGDKAKTDLLDDVSAQVSKTVLELVLLGVNFRTEIMDDDERLDRTPGPPMLLREDGADG